MTGGDSGIKKSASTCPKCYQQSFEETVLKDVGTEVTMASCRNCDFSTHFTSRGQCPSCRSSHYFVGGWQETDISGRCYSCGESQADASLVAPAAPTPVEKLREERFFAEMAGRSRERDSIAEFVRNHVRDIPEVIDMSVEDLFGEHVVVIWIPTSAEREKVKSLLSEVGDSYTLRIAPLLGLGFFTGNSEDTKRVLSLVDFGPHNIYWPAEDDKVEALIRSIEIREARVWAAMSEADKRSAIEKEIVKQRSFGRHDFGNCWSG